MRVKSESGEQEAPSWAPLLWPAGVAFLGLASLRSALYQHGVCGSAPLPAPTIAVGNLTFGGTGKTPFTIHLADRLLEAGLKPAVLLRGYGRKSRGPLLVRYDSREAEVGEEALLYKHALPNLPVAVGERREEAAALFVPTPDIFLLDDAYQHLRVKRDADILLVDASRPGDLRTPPIGRLREPLRALARAELLVVTRGSFDSLPIKFREKWGSKPAITARFVWEENLLPEGSGSVTSWRGRAVVAMCGIGNPASFFRDVKAAGLVLADSMVLEDHAHPDAPLIEHAKEALRRTGAGALFTTEKDALKWAPMWNLDMPLIYPRLRAEIDDPDDHLGGILNRLLKSYYKGASQ